MNKRGFKLEDREVKTRRKKKITIDPDAIGMIERFRATIETSIGGLRSSCIIKSTIKG